MIRSILFVVLLIAILSGGYYFYHMSALSKANDKEMEKYKNESLTLNKNLGKVLVVYYSHSGNAEKIAEIIKEKTNADIYKIELEENYPNMLKLAMQARKQQKSGIYPKLKNELPDFTLYDMIFIGGPVWNWTVTPPVLSFLSQADFKGKTVIPFVTHGGNPGKYFEVFNANAKNATIGKSIGFYNVLKENPVALDNKIIDWLNSL
jgi:flavodoxin